MPVTVKVGKRNPIESGGPLKLDIADSIDLVAPERDTPILRMLGFAASAEEVASATLGANSLQKDAIEMTHEWLNDTLVPSESTMDAAHTAADGIISVSAADSLYFRVDDVIRVVSSSVAAPLNELFFLVTAINTGNGNLSVTALNTDQNTGAADRVYIIGNAKVPGSEANTTGKHTVLTKTTNFTQIFSDDVIVTGSDESVEQYGINDPTARELDKTFQRLIVQFERACTWGVRSTTLPTDLTAPARMGGIFYYTRVAAGGLVQDLAGDPITEKALDDAISTLWNVGGTPDTMFCNAVGLREMRKFLRPFVQTERTERAAGLIIERYESALNINLDIVLDRHLGNGDFVIVTKEFIGVGPLKGNNNSRAFVAKEVPWQGGDYRKINIRGEYTMEVRNNTTHHIWLYGGASTVSS